MLKQRETIEKTLPKISSTPTQNIMKHKTRISKLLQGTLLVKGTIALGIVSSALIGTQQAGAASASWNVDADGSWGTGSNWNPAAAPGATTGNNSADVATFGVSLGAVRTVTVDANRNVAGITFSNTSAFGYTLSGGSLLLSNGGVIQGLAAGGAHNDQISTSVTIQGNAGTAAFTNNATSGSNRIIFNNTVTGVSTAGNTTTLTLNGSNMFANSVGGAITNGAGGGKLAVIKDGTGLWRLQGHNTFTGGVTLNAGKLGFTNTNSGGFGEAFGTGTLTINGGTLEAANPTGSITFNNAIIVNANFAVQDATSPANAWDKTFSGTMDLGGTTRTITANLTPGANPSRFIFSGVISNGGLIKAGADSLTLGGANTYTGNTTVTAGTLVLAAGSQTSFDIGASGTNNKILGTSGGSEGINLNGNFAFNLGGAGTGLGDSWNIVDMVNFTPTYGGTFGVVGFTDIGGNVWQKVNGGTTYQFSQATGVLSVVPEPATWALLAVGLTVVVTLRRRLDS